MYVNDYLKIKAFTNVVQFANNRVNENFTDNRVEEYFDEVRLSDVAKNLNNLLNGEKGELLEFVKKSTPDVRESKVQDVKVKLLYGEYDRLDIIEDLVDHLIF